MKKIRAYIFGIVGLSIFGFLLSEVDMIALKVAIKNVEWLYVAIAFGLYISVNCVRTLRFHILIPKVSFLDFFSIVGVQNFWNVVLPFRVGELSYVYLLNKRGVVGVGENLASLIASRVFDALSIIVISFASLFLLPSGSLSDRFFLGMGIVLAVGIICAIVFILYTDTLAGFIERKHFARTPKWVRVESEIVSLCKAISQLRRGPLLLPVASLSFLSWAIAFIGGAFLIKGAGVDLSLSGRLFAYAFPVVVSLTPLIGFAGFGSYEGSLILPLILLGVGKSVALPASIIVHISELIFVLLGTGIALLVSKWGERKTP